MDDPIDLRGLKCPLPALLTRRHLAKLPAGAVLSVITTDPLAVVDIPHMCGEDGHTVLECRQESGHHLFRVQRGG